jgi:hypothetical protein
MRSGPGVDEIMALPDELKAEALKAGWRFRNGWVCRNCQEDGHPDLNLPSTTVGS